MRAAVQTQFGGPEVLSVAEVATPPIMADQVLVRIAASSVTQGDRRLRAADYPGFGAVVGRLLFGITRPRNPIPGTNFAGTVIQVGEKVTRFSPGDRVFGASDHSAYAELLAVSEKSPLALVPRGTSLEDAAALPYGAATALAFVRDMARVEEGERVLVIGASGGVGRFAVQLARHYGAEVTGVCSPSKMALVRELGAHRVVDYASDYLNGHERYDVIFDTHTADSARMAKASLKSTGRFVTLYMTFSILLAMLFAPFRKGPKIASGVALPRAEILSEVAELAESGAIWPVVSARYPLDRIVEAHAALDAPSTQGTIVVTMDDAPERLRAA